MTTKHTLKSTPSHEFSVLHPADSSHPEAIQSLLNSIKQTNDSIRAATEAGISVELVRMSRMHNGQGHWGDQIAAAIRQPEAPRV